MFLTFFFRKTRIHTKNTQVPSTKCVGATGYQSWVSFSKFYRGGPIMSANFFTSGSKYQCKHRKFLLTRFVQKWGLEIPSAILKLLMFALIFGPSCVKSCTHIWTDLWRSLHSYLDPLVMKFALIYGPYHKKVCTHIWTLW